MKKARFRLIAGLVVGLAGAILLLARPWDRYSPLKLATLFAPERRVENFRTMDRILPFRVVRAAPTAFHFGKRERALDVRYDYEGEGRSLEQFLERVAATGLLVIKNDTILVERYFRGAEESSRMTSFSVAKSFVSTLVGTSLADGRIRSLDEPICDYAPELRGTAYDGVPIRHVLQMSSGVGFDERYDKRTSDINLLFLKLFAFGRRADDVFRDYGRERPSGEVLHYSSLDTQALGLMLRRIHGKSLATLLEERIWQPLGMEADALWNLDREGSEGVELAYCCLNARLRDFAKLGRLYLQHGEWNGRQLLPVAFTTEATVPSERHLQAGASPYGYGERGYQYQWWSPVNPDGEYFAAGVWGQYIYVSEPDRLIVVRSSADPEWRAHMGETMTVFRAIRDTLRANEYALAGDE